MSITCPDCGYVTNGKMARQNMMRHKRKMHPDAKGLICPICQSSGFSANGLKSHMKRRHPSGASAPPPKAARAPKPTPSPPPAPTPAQAPPAVPTPTSTSAPMTTSPPAQSSDPSDPKYQPKPFASIRKYGSGGHWIRKKGADGRYKNIYVMDGDKDGGGAGVTILRERQSDSAPPTVPMANGERSEKVVAREYRNLTDTEMVSYAKNNPVPSSGPIGFTPDRVSNSGHAPLIWWDILQSPEGAKFLPPNIKSFNSYVDIQYPDAPKGLMFELRQAFEMNREATSKGGTPVNMLLTGPPGTGKTFAVEAFAAETGLPYFYIPASTGVMSKDELLGHMVQDKETKVWEWHDGTIPKAAKYGGILHIDEFTLLDPEIQSALHELLDKKRSLSMMNLNGQNVRANPDLFIVASCNPAGTMGVKDLSEPIKRRFNTIEVGYPPMETELQIIKKGCDLDDGEFEVVARPDIHPCKGKYGADITNYMNAVSTIRKTAKTDSDITFVPTISEAQMFTRYLKKGRTASEALHLTITGKYRGEEKHKIELIVGKQFGPNYKSYDVLEAELEHSMAMKKTP
jgi:hypothetical protein